MTLQKKILIFAQKLYKFYISIDFLKNNTIYGKVSESLKGDITIGDEILNIRFPNTKQEMIGKYILVSRKT